MDVVVALSSSDMGRRGLSGGEDGLDKAVVGGCPVAFGSSLDDRE